MEQHAHTPQFRVFFAIQQAVMLQKATDPRLQIYARTSLSETLMLRGSFTAFVLLLSSFLQLSARSYQEGQQQKLIFVTTDLVASKICLKITAGGSFLSTATPTLLSDASTQQLESQQLLTESIQSVKRDFRGSFELLHFPERGSQIILWLPTQNDTRNHGRS